MVATRLSKKTRYFIQSLIVSFFIYLVSAGLLGFPMFLTFIFSLFLVVLGIFFSHYPNVNLKNAFITLLLPLSVIYGALLSLHYYPNLGLIFKIGVIIIFGVLYYIVSLIDNVFLVVEEKEDLIPLYRVAITWSQILQVVIAIPLFAGIFKINLNGIYQGLIVGLISFLFSSYQIWVSQFDKDAKRVGIGEVIFLSFFVLFVVVVGNILLSFLPVETFLRALFESAVLMFGITYVTAYLKNEITNKMLFQYILIFIFLLGLIMFFKP